MTHLLEASGRNGIYAEISASRKLAARTSNRVHACRVGFGLATALTFCTGLGVVPTAHAGSGCEEVWNPMGAGLGLGQDGAGIVYCFAEATNGAIYAGGIFDRAGFTRDINNIAIWNGIGWNRLGSGLRFSNTPSGVTHAMAVLTNGDLVAGGCFSIAGNVAVDNVARWDGTAWHSMAAGLQGCVFALAALPNGQVVAGGSFQRVLGTNVLVNHIARWNGSAWVPMAGGLTSPPNSDSIQVRSLAVTPAGHVIVGGRFTTAGTTVANGIARWDGTGWHALGPGFDGVAGSVAVHPNGAIVAAGSISVIGDPTQRHLLSWDGTSWSQVGDRLDGSPQNMIVRGNGDIVVMGALNAGSVFIGGLGVWNGSHWAPVSTGVQTVYGGASLSDGSLIVGGTFGWIGNDPVYNVARYSFPTSCPCDSIDFNNNGTRFEPTDIEAFLSVYAEGPCQPDGFNLGCNDIDFNNDGSFFDPCDFESFLLVFSEGPCTPCGQ